MPTFVVLIGLKKIPSIATDVFEYRDHTMRLLLRRPDEFYASAFVEFIIAPKIVGVQK